MGKSQLKSTSRHRLVRATVAVAASLLAVGIGEIVVRGLGRVPALKAIVVHDGNTVYRRSANPILGFELKAGYRDENADLSRSYPSTNAHGRRDIERTIAKPPGVKRIVLLGDSVVEGHGIRAIDDTMSRRLERLYEDGKTEVLNFGVSGYCTLAEVELLRVKGLMFEPDVVVLIFVDNDFHNFNREAFQLGGPVPRPQAVKYLFANCHLFRLLCLKLNLFYFGAEADPVRWNKGAIGDNNVVDGLKLLSQLAVTYGFQPIIAIWPGFLDDRIIDFRRMPDSSDELVIKRLGRLYGVPTVRLSHYFTEYRQSIGRPTNPRLLYTLGDAMHPSQEGCRVAAQALKTALPKLSALPRSEAEKPLPSPPRDADPEAIAAAAALGKQKPDYSRLHLNIGNVLKGQGRLDEAINYYRQAVAADGDYSEARHNLGVALYEQGSIDEAIQHFRHALKIKDRLHETHYCLALSLHEQGKIGDVLHHLRQTVRYRPDYVPAHVILGFTLDQEGKTDEAIVQYEKVLRLDPDNAEAYLNLATARKRNGQFAAALVAYEEALRCRPNWVEPLNNMAWFLATHPDADVRRADQAIEFARRAVALTENQSPKILDTLAAAHAIAGHFDEAVASAKAALKLSTNAGGDALSREIRKHLELYRRGAPYREPESKVGPQNTQ